MYTCLLFTRRAADVLSTAGSRCLASAHRVEPLSCLDGHAASDRPRPYSCAAITQSVTVGHHFHRTSEPLRDDILLASKPLAG